MLSFAVSDLDTYRYYLDSDTMTIESALRRLRRQDGPSVEMAAGTALHSLLDDASDSMLADAERDGHRFIFTLNADLHLMPFDEVSGRKTYILGNRAIELRGRVDQFFGLDIADHKFTTSSFDAEKYLDAYQWRAYLSIFGASRMIYNVFVGKDLGVANDGVHEWEIRELHRLTCHRYPEMETDLMAAIAGFVDFVDDHDVYGRKAIA